MYRSSFSTRLSQDSFHTSSMFASITGSISHAGGVHYIPVERRMKGGDSLFQLLTVSWFPRNDSKTNLNKNTV